ncbi:MAG: hypothetical protein ACREVL_20130, partial [Solimonas sp.]
PTPMTVLRACRLAAALLLAVAAGCSSQDDNIDTPIVRPVSIAPAGIYAGTWASTRTGVSKAVTVFVDNKSTMMMFDDTGALIASGAYTTVEAARSINWSARVFVPGTETDPDTGETTATTVVTTLTAQGGYAEQASLLLSYAGSDGDSGTISVSYDKTAYETRSDVSLIQGNWGIKDAFGAATISIAINAGGSFFGTDVNNCNYSGSFTILDQQYNLYAVSVVTQCAGSAANSTTIGLATLKKPSGTTTTSTLVAVTANTSAALLWKLKPL